MNMKMKNFLAAVMLSCMIAPGAAIAQNTGIDKANLNTNVKPGDDFYEYADGGWIKNHPVRPEYGTNSPWIDIYETNQKQLLDIIIGYAKTPQKKGTLAYKIGTLYNMYMDSVKLNKEKAAPIKPILAKINAVRNYKEYIRAMADIESMGVGGIPIGIGVGTNQKDVGQNIVSLHQGGIRLPNRDYYLKDDSTSKAFRAAYREHAVNLLMLAGNSKAAALKKMQASFAIEKAIAQVMFDNVKLRDVNLNCNVMSYQAMKKMLPQMDWDMYFTKLGYPKFNSIDVSQVEPIKAICKLLASKPISDLKAYSELGVIRSASEIMGDAFHQENFRYSQKLTGIAQDMPRWKNGVGLVSDVLSEAIGKLYVEKYFPEGNKQKVVSLVKDLQNAMIQRIQEAKWMGDATKAKAIEKMEKMTLKIGYPDKWKNYDKLNIDENQSLCANMFSVHQFMTRDEIERKVNKPVDRTEWAMSPQTINAYYQDENNSINFPAGILQSPFFDINADDAYNYAAIGSVIGHEMSHGFDDQGCQFDDYGNQKNWWTAEDKKHFDERAKALVNYYDAFEPVPGQHIIGAQTLGENIGDNGGVNIAYRALQNRMKTNPLGEKDGMTPSQRFFLAFAYLWTENTLPAITAMQMRTDVHSPSKYRVNGVVPMIDAWYDAFNIQPTDKMYLPAEKRVHIW
jgi:putative endopeptidase